MHTSLSAMPRKDSRASKLGKIVATKTGASSTQAEEVEPSRNSDTEIEFSATSRGLRVHVNALFQTPPPGAKLEDVAAFYKKQAEQLASQICSREREEKGEISDPGPSNQGATSGRYIGEEV